MKIIIIILIKNKTTNLLKAVIKIETDSEILVAFQTDAESCRFQHVSVFASTSFWINV
jgi:hypothetical protein